MSMCHSLLRKSSCQKPYIRENIAEGAGDRAAAAAAAAAMEGTRVDFRPRTLRNMLGVTLITFSLLTHASDTRIIRHSPSPTCDSTHSCVQREWRGRRYTQCRAQRRGNCVGGGARASPTLSPHAIHSMLSHHASLVVARPGLVRAVGIRDRRLLRLRALIIRGRQITRTAAPAFATKQRAEQR